MFFPVHFSPDLLGSWLCIILDPTGASSKKSTDRKLRCFLLFILFVFIFCFVSFRFFFSTCYCHFFAFCCIFFPYTYQIRSKSNKFRVVTWYMGSGLKTQNMTGIRAQRKGLRAQNNGIRDQKAFEPESGIRFITRSKNLLSQYFSA